LKNNQDKHKIELNLSCEQFENVAQAAAIVGINDLEDYIKSVLAERC